MQGYINLALRLLMHIFILCIHRHLLSNKVLNIWPQVYCYAHDPLNPFAKAILFYALMTVISWDISRA